ncbi:MAG: hypothetical protein R3223_13225 [Longimicrobiales bacterium]|nr:hypothetical protein [Longimicrobiales bacterium]
MERWTRIRPPTRPWFTSWGWPDATHIVVENAGHEALMPYPPAQSAIVDFFRGVDVSERTIPAPRLDFLGVDEVRTMLER